MKFSKETIAVLKNYSSINPNIMLKGSVLTTISPQRNVVASVSVEEKFPVDFGIYDLSQFLGVLSLFSDPDITFTDKVATFKEGKNSIKYYAADAAVLKLPPDKQIKFPNADVSLKITTTQLGQVIKTAGVLGAPDFSIVGDGETISLVVGDLNVDTGNQFSIELDPTDMTFSANFKVENLKMIVQDYSVEISSKGLSKWTAESGDMTLYVALESTSKF